MFKFFDSEIACESPTGILLRFIFLSLSLPCFLHDGGRIHIFINDGGDQSEGHLFGVPFHGRPSFLSLDSVDETESANGHITSISSQVPILEVTHISTLAAYSSSFIRPP